MHRRFCFRLLLVFAWLLPGFLFAQYQQLGNIVGQIHVTRGDFPPHQILVELRLHGSTLNSVYADGQGRFAFGSLLANEYRIVINDETYVPVDERVNVDPASATTNVVPITLFPREVKKTSDPIGARASGSNPYLTDPGDYNKRFPKKAVQEYERGLQAEHKGRAEEAMAHYREALKTAPDYFPAHNNLGSIYLSNKDFKSAEEQFREAIRLDPNDAQAYLNLGNMLMLSGRYAESETALADGMQRRPDSAFAHFLQGALFARTGKFEDAEKSLHEALQLDPSMSQAHLQLVNLYLRQNRKDDAIRQLQDFLKAFPTAPPAAKAREVLNKLQAEKVPDSR